MSSPTRLILLLILCCSSLLLDAADTLTGEARGLVLETVGRVPLPDTTVTLINVDRGRTRVLETDADGESIFIQLEPGNYTARAEKEGYYTSEKTGILIRLNQPKIVIPSFELRSTVNTPTQQTLVVQGEETKLAVIDLTAPDPSVAILAFINERGFTSLTSPLDWTLRYNFDGSLLRSLPLQGGRTFDQLSLLSPGVFRVPFSAGEGPAVGVGVGTAGQLSVNGMRARSNNFTVDGSDNNDEDIGVRRQGFVALVPQTIESIQDFQVVTAGFPAEFGRNSGSMVNAVSRSGQSDTHGTVYGFFNDDILDARNYFEHPFRDTVNSGNLHGGSFQDKESSRKQYGAVLGGSIVTDRLYYFVSAEQQRASGTAMRHFVVPRADERGLRIKDGFVPIDELEDFFDERNINYSALAGEGVFDLCPLPNNPAGPFAQNNYSQAKQYEGRANTFSVKIDWYPSTNHSVAARYNFTDDSSVLPFTSEAINSTLDTSTRTQNLSLFLNSTFEKTGNALRVSYGRTNLGFPQDRSSPFLFGSVPSDVLSPLFAQTITTPYGQFGPFGATGAIGQLAMTPYSAIGIDVFNFPQGRVDNTFQFSDFITWTTRSHTVKVGFDIRRSQLNSFSDRNARPLVMFGNGIVSGGCRANPLCVFGTADGLLRGTDLAALGAPAGFLQTISTLPIADTAIGLRFTQFDVFAQNDWQVLPNLRLNFGLRYERQTVPKEVNRRIENTFGMSPDDFPHMEPSGSPVDRQIIRAGNLAFDRAFESLQGVVGQRENIYRQDRNNFGPRVGMVWDPTGDTRTTIRAGISIQFDANLGSFTSNSRNVFPTFAPMNFDLNFNPPDGRFLNNPGFFVFGPTDEPLIEPGTLNTYNLQGDAFATGLGTLLIQAPPFPGASLSSNGLAFTLPVEDLPTSFARHIVFNVERQLGDNFVTSLGYVGTRGYNLPRFATPNGGMISTPVLLSSPSNPLSVFDLPPAQSASTGRPVANLGAFSLLENSAGSSYHSLQLSVQNRLGARAHFRVNWTWAHAIDELSDQFDGRGFFALPQNGLNPGLERASASFDVRHRITGFLVWSVPEIARLGALNDWTLSVIGELQTGQPFTVNTSLDRNGDGNLTDRLHSLSGIQTCSGCAQVIEISPGSIPFDLIAPRGEDGVVGRNTFRADGIVTVDAAISKSFQLREATSVEFRIEAFNVFNQTNFGIPGRILESPGFGRVFDTQVDARSIKLAAKLNF